MPETGKGPLGFLSAFPAFSKNSPGRRKDRTVGDIWHRVWLAFNEFAGHAVLVIVVVLFMFGLHTLNDRLLNPPNGMDLFEAPLKIRLDSMLSVIDAGALSRLAWAAFWIFKNL